MRGSLVGGLYRTRSSPRTLSIIVVHSGFRHPKARTMQLIDFDGKEESIAEMLGCKFVAFEQIHGVEHNRSSYIAKSPVTRFYFGAEADGNAAFRAS